MNEVIQRRRFQFSIAWLLLGLGVFGLMIAPLAMYFRILRARPNIHAHAILMVRRADSSGIAEGMNWIPDVYNRVLENPQVRQIESLKSADDPQVWLDQHLTHDRRENSELIIVNSRGHRNRMSPEDIDLLLKTFVRLLIERASEDKVQATVVTQAYAASP